MLAGGNTPLMTTDDNTITIEEFISFLMDSYDIKKSAAVAKAAELMGLNVSSVWSWLYGTKPPSRQSIAFMLVLRELILLKGKTD